MERASGIRRRIPIKEANQGLRDASDRRVQSHRPLVLVGKLVFLTLFALSACLLYVFNTSPTSAVVIVDFHDVSKLEWTKVNNDDLLHGEKVLADLVGPESIVVDDVGNWYTGLHDGRLLRIAGGETSSPKIVDITATVNYSAGAQRTERGPLGLRLFQNNLYLADGYQGIFKIDIKTFSWDKIVGYDEVSPVMAFPDDLALSADGNVIYFTDMSTKWMYHQVPFSVIEGECSGRVFKVDIKSGKVEMLRDGLCLPNGIEVNRKGTEIAVSEGARQRISILDIQTGETIRHVLLPGGADNIRAGKTEGYWITIPAMHNPAVRYLYYYPFVRDIVAGILGVDGLYKLTNIDQGTVIKLDEEFEPVSIHFDRDGKVCQALSEAREYSQGRFLLASFAAPGIVTIDGIGRD